MEQQNEIVNTEAKKIIHTLEDEQKAEHELSPKKTSSVFDGPAPAQENKIVHTLSLEEEEEIEEEPESNYPSEAVKNMDVVYEEVKPAKEPDFIITDSTKEIEVREPEVVNPEPREQQFMFTFDMPRNAPSSEREEPKREQPQPKHEENAQAERRKDRAQAHRRNG